MVRWQKDVGSIPSLLCLFGSNWDNLGGFRTPKTKWHLRTQLSVSSGFSYHSGFLFQHFLAFSIISSHKFKSHEKLFQIGFGFPLISQQSPTNPKEQKERFGGFDRFMPFFDHSFDHCGVVIVPSKGLISIPLFGGWTSLLGSLLSLVLDFFLLWSHGCSVEDTYE